MTNRVQYAIQREERRKKKEKKEGEKARGDIFEANGTHSFVFNGFFSPESRVHSPRGFSMAMVSHLALKAMNKASDKQTHIGFDKKNDDTDISA